MPSSGGHDEQGQAGGVIGNSVGLMSELNPMKVKPRWVMTGSRLWADHGPAARPPQENLQENLGAMGSLPSSGARVPGSADAADHCDNVDANHQVARNRRIRGAHLGSQNRSRSLCVP